MTETDSGYELPVRRKPVTARLLWAIVAVLAALTMAVVVVYFVTSSQDANNSAMRNRDLIEELQAQLVDQAAQIQTNLDARATATQDDLEAQAAKVECVTRFTYAIQAASSDLLLANSDLVVVISTTTPGVEREAAIGDGVIAVAVASDDYRKAIKARIDFDVKGSPLPCPLKPGLTG